MKKILFSISIMAILLASTLAFIPAQSAFPGENGLIAFASNRDGDPKIWTLDPNNPDPTQTQLTYNGDVADMMPAWSADGSKIAFTRFYETNGGPEVWIMNADGTEPEYLTDGWSPAWSPDGTQIAFTRGLPDGEIWIIDIDSKDEYPILAEDDEWFFMPAWSPDGEAIAFAWCPEAPVSVIGIVDVDSGEWGPITDPPEEAVFDLLPDWAPDGSHIVFTRMLIPPTGGIAGSDLWVIGEDFPDEIPLLIDEEWWDWHPAWSPDGTQIVFSRMHSTNVGALSTLNTDEEVMGYLLGLESFTILPNGVPGIVVMDLESEELELLSDYGDFGPDWQPILPEPAVGGEIAPLSLIALLPWIAIAAAAIAVAALGYTITRKKPLLH